MPPERIVPVPDILESDPVASDAAIGGTMELEGAKSFPVRGNKVWFFQRIVFLQRTHGVKGRPPSFRLGFCSAWSGASFMELMVARKDFRLKFLYEGIHGQ